MTDEELRQKITECLPISGGPVDEGGYIDCYGEVITATIDELVELFKTYCAEERARRDTNTT